MISLPSFPPGPEERFFKEGACIGEAARSRAGGAIESEVSSSFKVTLPIQRSSIFTSSNPRHPCCQYEQGEESD